MPEMPDDFVNTRPLPSALRELRAIVTTPEYLISVAGIAAILAIVGAFGSDQFLRPVPRFFYWLAIVAGTSCIGSLVTDLVIRSLRLNSYALRVLIGGIVAALPIALVVVAINMLGLGGRFDLNEFVTELLPQVTVISLIVAATSAYVFRPKPPANGSADGPAKILERLQFDKRGALISLSVQDHYTEVVTDEGRELVLLRLSDAIKEAAPVAGLQIHRSHWVAFAAVVSARREGERALVTLQDGRELPVSRGYLPAVKAAGLLPR